MTDLLRGEPGQHFQGTYERRPYVFNVGSLIAAPTEACATMLLSGVDVSASVLCSAASGGATISGCLITTPCVVSLADATDYTLRIYFSDNSASHECYVVVTGVEVT